MIIDIYLSNQIVKKWFSKIIGDIILQNEYVVHKNLETLNTSLLNMKSNRLIILDIEDQISIDYFTSINHSFNNINFIAIGLNKPVELVINYLSLGFKGVIDLNYSSIEFYQIIHKASAGLKYLSILQQEQLLNILTNNSETINSIKAINRTSLNSINTIKPLSDKEKIVFEMLIKGITYKEIAGAIGISGFTVNQRAKAIYKKLNVRSRGELSYRYLGINNTPFLFTNP
jgi:DNA-binding NarL/FixJ family response regulator